MRKLRKATSFGCGGLLILCLALAVISTISNRGLPTRPQPTDRLDPLDKARLEESIHLKSQLGESVWPGWGKMEIPIILWNQDYSFLITYPDQPPGWEVIPDDTFFGQFYYRQPSDDPQNFAVNVDERWVASIGTKYEMDASLIGVFQELLPPVIEKIFPYRLLILPSEVQISAALHESFHVYQAEVVRQRLEAAESAHKLGDAYWQADESMHDAWAEEIEKLSNALAAPTDQEAAEWVRQFLGQRLQRRSSQGLTQDLIDYERWLEWEEGLAKYVELAIWKAAYEARAYQPVDGLANDPDFKRYATFPQRWSQEVDQMKRQAKQDGETRFYYTGMAQAMLLERLMVNWKARILSENVWLETLLGAIE